MQVGVRVTSLQYHLDLDLSHNLPSLSTGGHQGPGKQAHRIPKSASVADFLVARNTIARVSQKETKPAMQPVMHQKVAEQSTQSHRNTVVIKKKKKSFRCARNSTRRTCHLNGMGGSVTAEHRSHGVHGGKPLYKDRRLRAAGSCKAQAADATF